MPLTGDESLPILSDEDVVILRQRVRARAVQLGFSLVEQTKIVTAASELGRNTLVHGKGGTVCLQSSNDGARARLKLTFEDKGPGIADIELAMRDGYSTGTGMGLGLSGSKRLCNDFEIWSKVGEGTRVTISRWK